MTITRTALSRSARSSAKGHRRIIAAPLRSADLAVSDEFRIVLGLVSDRFEHSVRSAKVCGNEIACTARFNRMRNK